MTTVAMLLTLVTAAAQPTLSTDRKVYKEGEPILVTASGSVADKDWVGIQPKNDPDTKGNSIYWYYLTEETNGKPVDIKAAGQKSSRPNQSDYDLPAGDYIVYFVPNNGYAKDKTEIVEITIKDHVAPNRREYIEGEPILVTGTGSAANKDWIGIQPKDDNGSSIYWYYITAETDRKPVDIKAVGQKSNRPDPTDYDLPAGTYIVYFVPSNGYASAKTETAEIVIRSKDAEVGVLEAPSAITYTLKNETDGMADGTVTVTLPDGSPAADLLMYWSNADGILEGYTALAKFKVTGNVTEHAMTPNTLIPQGATALRVYAMKGSKVSEGYAEVALPAGAASGDFGDPLNEFQVISDIHLNLSNEHLYNENFRKVLADIAANSPGSTDIYINGDIANTGKAEEYANMWEIYNAAKAQSTLPGIYLAIGNHDFFGVTGYKDGVDLFLENAYLPGGEHPDQLYYDFWKDGYHFIFLGSDRYPINNVNAYLSKTQLDWLDAKLAESRNINAPTFVFLHQSLSNTVAGSFEGQGWSGATPEAALRAILKKYPEVIFFNGHSHWTLNSEGNMYARDGKLPTIFNTSSTAYLWTSYNVAKGEALAGSEGYYVRIYADKVVVLGRNFTTGEWMPSAMYVVDYSDVSRYLPEDQNGGENNGNEQNTDPVVTTDDPGSGTAPAGSENTGCRSVGSLAWSLLAPAAAAVLFLFPRRKRREE